MTESRYRRPALTEGEKKRIVSAYEAGLTLRDLARRYQCYEASGIDAPTGERVTWTGEALTLYHPHPRAFDALEAALLVLAGETPLVAAGQGAMCRLVTPVLPVDELAESEVGKLVARSSIGQGLSALQTDPETEMQQLDEELTPEVMQTIIDAAAPSAAWAEQVALGFEERAVEHLRMNNTPTTAYHTGVADGLQWCAAELRERAKGGERG